MILLDIVPGAVTDLSVTILNISAARVNWNSPNTSSITGYYVTLHIYQNQQVFASISSDTMKDIPGLGKFIHYYLCYLNVCWYFIDAHNRGSNTL